MTLAENHARNKKILSTVESCLDYIEVATTCLEKSFGGGFSIGKRLYHTILVASMTLARAIIKWEEWFNTDLDKETEKEVLDALEAVRESCNSILDHHHKGENNGRENSAAL